VTFIPGLGIVKGMAFTLRRFFEPKATIMYPEQPPDHSVRFRGRLQLLYDEYGTLKCETCFQCAQACPIECIDMGGIDTKERFHVHWGMAETYGERREESALRRAGRTVPDPAYSHFALPDDLGAVDEILEDHDYDPGRMLQILEATQERYGYLPVATLKRIAHKTGAWYAMIYGTASYYRHLRFEAPDADEQAAAVEAHRPSETSYLAALGAALAGAGASGPAADARSGGAGSTPPAGRSTTPRTRGRAPRRRPPAQA
jgi:hypothetical protein